MKTRVSGQNSSNHDLLSALLWILPVARRGRRHFSLSRGESKYSWCVSRKFTRIACCWLEICANSQQLYPMPEQGAVRSDLPKKIYIPWAANWGHMEYWPKNGDRRWTWKRCNGGNFQIGELLNPACPDGQKHKFCPSNRVIFELKDPSPCHVLEQAQFLWFFTYS